jgi:hypothetical protein
VYTSKSQDSSGRRQASILTGFCLCELTLDRSIESPLEACALSAEPEPAPDLPEDWPRNYFNYFTEIEDHFRRARGTGLFLLSPLDWALIETWRNAGIPLEAVLKGISQAFEKWHSRKQKRRMVNSVAYCTQAVMEFAGRTPVSRARDASAHTELFDASQIATHLNEAAGALSRHPDGTLQELSLVLNDLSSTASEYVRDLEALEQRLTVMEEKIVAHLRSREPDQTLLAIRQGLDAELRPYRGKMTADQLALLERRYLDSALLEKAGLPRLSLFYLR